MSNLILLVSGFFLVGYYFYISSGWRILAKEYKTNEPFEGTLIKGVSACFKTSEYFNGTIAIGRDNQYLYVSQTYIFKWFYPALLIPLEDIVVSKESFPKLFRAKFSFNNYPDIYFRVTKRTANKLGFEV